MNNEIISNTCKFGQGTDCCRYLALSGRGWICMKYDAKNKAAIDQAWAEFPHKAQGDNCAGKESLNFK